MNSRYLSKPLAPTQSLPQLAQLQITSSFKIKVALDALCALYFPHTLSVSAIITDPLSSEVSALNLTPASSSATIPSYWHKTEITTSTPDSGYASAEEDDDGLDTKELQAEDAISALRSDPFERAYAIRWLTGFVGRSDTWLSHSSFEDEGDSLRGELVEEAARLINAFSGATQSPVDDETKEGGSIGRSFSFSTPTPGSGGDSIRSSTEISIHLNDAPLSSSDHTSVGLQSWGSSIILAERISADPFAFAILATQYRCGIANHRLRVLELGAGTGLLTIAASKILQLHSEPAEIIATDYHPDVLENLSLNVDTNLQAEPRCPSVSVHAFDWEHPDYSSPPFGKPFDVIFAADVVYHPSHATWIKSCAERLLRKPIKQNRGGFFWLIIPDRTTGRHEGMHFKVENVFPIAGLDNGRTRTEAEAYELNILELQKVPRREGVGRADESGYRLYKIGWCTN